MKKIIFIFLMASGSLFAQKKQKMSVLIDQQFHFAAEQYGVLKHNIASGEMPRTFNPATGKVVTSDTKWWCSGFYPGSLLYIYEYTKNPDIKAEAEKRLAILEKEKHYLGNHDLGFMMYCSFGNAYRLFHKAEDKATIDTSAMSLATRYRPSIESIQSWDSNELLKCPVIIDNMMNLEMLCWVSDNGGDKRFKEIAINHANTTLKTHFRADNSSYHLVDYDLKTGQIIKKITWQGLADSSAWARGQGWGLYGYTMMYRFTKDKNYLNQARKIAAFLINHPNLPADKIPYWDYNAPNTPTQYRDASAGALIASALLELGQYTGAKEKKLYVNTAETMLRSLASDKYRAKLGENGGFLLLHSVGHMPNKTEIDVPLTYADYYYLEALLRYKKWYL
ncbi:glycoside hydrolase family 88 protein [Pedobacter borealis]|uniref:glycoside hydrolase family 88 protein n=1 Tax=Pedobacter borealis TaxID=475254 RepID=UPI0004932778|nr:glycoside hydrolase family 88 protein [Pedobacter borealis]